MPEIHHPRQVILVTSRAKMNVLGKEVIKDDIITLAWHMPTSFDPDLYAISVGKTRYSYKLINKSKVFCVNFIPYELKDQALFCGRHRGEHTDKFKMLGKDECEKIDCPRIKEALAYLECEVINEIETGDHVIFVSQVLNQQIKKKGKRLFQSANGFTTTED